MAEINFKEVSVPLSFEREEEEENSEDDDSDYGDSVTVFEVCCPEVKVDASTHNNCKTTGCATLLATTVQKKTVKIDVAQAFMGSGTTGWKVWNGALACKAILENAAATSKSSPPSGCPWPLHALVDCSAGTGVTGLAALALGVPEVVLSDVVEATPLLRVNVRRNITALRRHLTEGNVARVTSAKEEGGETATCGDGGRGGLRKGKECLWYIQNSASDIFGQGQHAGRDDEHQRSRGRRMISVANYGWGDVITPKGVLGRALSGQGTDNDGVTRHVVIVLSDVLFISIRDGLQRLLATAILDLLYYNADDDDDDGYGGGGDDGGGGKNEKKGLNMSRGRSILFIWESRLPEPESSFISALFASPEIIRVESIPSPCMQFREEFGKGDLSPESETKKNESLVTAQALAQVVRVEGGENEGEEDEEEEEEEEEEDGLGLARLLHEKVELHGIWIRGVEGEAPSEPIRRTFLARVGAACDGG